MHWRLFLSAVLCLLPNTGSAQEAPPVEKIEAADVAEVVPERYGADFAQADRTYNLLVARTARRGSYIVTINHRAYEAVSKDPWFDYLGLDGGSLKIGLGVRYGLLEGLDVGLFRLNGTVEKFDTYELDLRYQILDQARFDVDVAVRGGLSWFSQKNAKDAAGGFAQLLVDRVFADRVLVGAGLLFHTSSSNDVKTDHDKTFSLAASLCGEYRFLPNLAADLELAQTLAGYHSRYPTFTVGMKAYTHLHTFSLLVTNTQYIAADGVVANTWRGGPKDWIIGFNITRELLA